MIDSEIVERRSEIPVALLSPLGAPGDKNPRWSRRGGSVQGKALGLAVTGHVAWDDECSNPKKPRCE